jgi:hypothetical protein
VCESFTQHKMTDAQGVVTVAVAERNQGVSAEEKKGQDLPPWVASWDTIRDRYHTSPNRSLGAVNHSHV